MSKIATNEYLTAADTSAKETTTIRQIRLPNAKASKKDRAMAKMFWAAVSGDPSSCAVI